MEVSLDGPERSARRGRDLGEAQVGEEAERDGLAIWLVESGDRGSDIGGPFGAERGDSRIGTAGKVERPIRIGRIDPRHVSPLLGAAEGDPDGDPGQPRGKGTVRPPPGQAPERGHECLLGRILGFVDVAEDAVAGADDRGRVPIDEDAKGLAISGEDRIDRRAFIDDLDLIGWND